MRLCVPALWALGCLAGWLALQLVSGLVVRPRRARLKALVAALTADERYGVADRALIKEVIDEAHGNTMIMVFPLVIPTALFMLAITGIVRRIRSAQNSSPLEALELIRFQDHELKLLRDVTTSQRTVRNDPRFRRLSELAVEVEVCRWPLVALLTVTLSLPALVLYLIAHGVRETMLIMPQLGLLFAHALRLPRPT